MKRLACLLPLLACLADAAPAIDQTGEELTVRTARYAATFAADSGLLHTLALADGTPLLVSSRVYNDVLPDGRKGFGPKATAPAKATPQADGSVVVEVAGRLLDAEGNPHPVFPLGYRARYQFDDSAQVRLAVSLVPEFDSEAVYGFAAHILSLAAHREFFVNTADGLISELAATRSTRTYQSEGEPLSMENPYLGVVLQSGQVVVFRFVAGVDSLLNIFLHDSGTGPTHLFLAQLSGPTSRQTRKGDAWTHELVIETIPLAEWGKTTP